MEDLEIIELYWKRDESAIEETNTKYGKLLHKISLNILSNFEDSQECVNDTYIKVWKSIPPQRPKFFTAYLGRIVRNVSINRWHESRAQKRYSSGDILLSELADCVPSSGTTESEIETKVLSEIISKWLFSLPKNDRVLFVRRYWYGDSIKELAIKTGTTPNKLAGHMYRLRYCLKNALEKEEVSL